VSHPNDPQHRHLWSTDGLRRPFPARARNDRQRPPAGRPAAEGNRSGVEDQAEATAPASVNVPPALKPAATLNKPSMWRPRPTRSGRHAVVGFVAGLALMACVYAGFAAFTGDGPEQGRRPDATGPALAAPTVPAPSGQPPQSTSAPSASPTRSTPSGRPTVTPPVQPAPSTPDRATSPTAALSTVEQTPVAATEAAATKTKKPKKPKKSKSPT
jgi:hypothetical protein